MYGKEIKEEYCRWLKMCADEALCAELKEMDDRSEDLLSAFGSELSFGTGGLRGKIGVGTAKMNVYTVARATAGLAKYLKSNGGSAVAIGYDTRRYSRKFAEISAFVLSTFGIRSYVYSSPLPTPMLSYAVRELKLSAGIMITASHNPAIYNGYKVYGSDGCQITDRAADEILSFIKDSDYFDYNICESLGALLEEGIVEYIKEETYNNYLNEVSGVVPGIDEKPLSDVKIVYTPLNGTGYKPVTDALTRNGYNNLITVVEQAFPDENFTTCPKPNPELDEALRLGLLQAKKENADVLIATDPDSDRVGIIAKNGKTYQRLTGNEVGLLLLDYVLSIKEANGSLPKEPIILKTIVTTPLAERIADARSIKVKNLLTGFKYIGEAIGDLADKSNFVFGFEESCGYLGGSYVRDKDGVYAALAVTKMTDYYKSQGISLPEKLESIYKKYGYCKDRLISHEFDSADGKNRISGIMELFRTKNLPIGVTVAEKFDYLDGIDGLPVSDVLQFTFAGGDSLTVRPSGTEPKIKFYYYTIGKTSDEADDKMERLVKLIEDFID